MVHLEQTRINQYSMHFVSFESREPAQLHSSVIALQLHPSWEMVDLFVIHTRKSCHSYKLRFLNR